MGLPLNNIICGNNLEILKTIPDESIDLICTDPPYGINYKDWDKFDFSEFTNQWLKQCFRVLKPSC